MQRFQILKRQLIHSSRVALCCSSSTSYVSSSFNKSMILRSTRAFSSLPDYEVVGLPALSPTMETGTIAKWRKKEGELISPGDIICEVETDKAVVDYEAQDEYYLAKILKAEGTADIKVGEPIFVTVEDASDVAAFKTFALEGEDASSSSAIPAPQVEAPPVSASVSVSVPASASSSAPVARSSDDRVFASPFAKKLAREAGVTLGAVGGSGPKGRVIAADVLAAISNGAIQPEGVASTPPIVASVASAPTAATTEGIVVAPVSSTVEYTDYPISQEAQLFAQQLTQQKLNVPHYHLSIDLTLDKLLHAREQLNAERKEEEKLSVNDFILRAASLAMKKIPQVNSTWKETFIRQFHEVNINLIVSSHGGILNPVIKRVDTKGLDEINQTVRSIMTKATTTTKESFFPNDFTNGTFTISNVGMYDVRSLAAIVSPNQACSLGIGTIEKKIVPNDDPNAQQIYKYAMVMNATLACDHRVIDGAVGAQWLAVFKELVEDPLKMIL